MLLLGTVCLKSSASSEYFFKAAHQQMSMLPEAYWHQCNLPPTPQNGPLAVLTGCCNENGTRLLTKHSVTPPIIGWGTATIASTITAAIVATIAAVALVVLLLKAPLAAKAAALVSIVLPTSLVLAVVTATKSRSRVTKPKKTRTEKTLQWPHRRWSGTWGVPRPA